MVTVSEAKKEECQQIRALEQKVWGEECTSNLYDLAYFVQYGYAFVAKDKDTITGTIIAMKTRDDEIKIIDWVVDERYRRKGIGRKLYEKLIECVGTTPIIAFTDAENLIAIEAHKKLSFKTIEEIIDPLCIGDDSRWIYMRRE